MLDLKLVEEKPELLKKSLEERGMNDLAKELNNFLEARMEWKELKKELDGLRHKRNVISLEINELVKQKKDAKHKKKEAKKVAEGIEKIESRTRDIENKINSISLNFPNLMDSKLPKQEKIIGAHGKTKEEKWRKDYIELSKELGLIDFNSATKMSGEGFYILKYAAAILQRALINFCLDSAKKKGYKEIALPVLVNEKAAINSAHLPRFIEGMYKTQDNFYLSPTEEVGLLNLYVGRVFKEKELPVNLSAYSPSFRTEKGATKGIARAHQFDEVELFKITKQKESEKELQKMLKDVTHLLKALNLPYRIKLLPASDMATQSSITYDIEIFSAKSGWLEISSCSNCLDFQARRARIYYMNQGKKELVHTLNGTALGLNRVLIAVIENFQKKDGSIKIPTVLQKYCGFSIIKPLKNKVKKKKIKKKKSKKKR